jgi:hypothetical protein
MLYLPGFAGALLAVLFLLYARDLLPDSTRTAAMKAAPYVMVAAVVPIVLFSFARTRGVSEDAARYEQFVTALRREIRDMPSGGTLYIANPPRSGPFTPDSVIVSLVGLYYPSSSVVVLAPGETPSSREPDDRVFQYRP